MRINQSRLAQSRPTALVGQFSLCCHLSPRVFSILRKSALYVNKKMLSVQNKFDFSVNNLPYSDRLTFLHLHKNKLFLISGYKHWLCVEEKKNEGFLCKDAPFCSHDLLPLSDSRSSATLYPLGNSILYVKGYHSGLTILA